VLDYLLHYIDVCGIDYVFAEVYAAEKEVVVEFQNQRYVV
jgi:hypothetical protein